MENTTEDERLGLPSGSNWRRYELCAGSWQLEQEAKRLGQAAHETSPAAERGTLIHAYLAGELDEDGNPIELDEEAQKTADFLQERSQGEVARIFGDAPWQQLSEKRLWLMVGGKKVASGKFDRCVYNDKLALVQDFKTGWREPDAAEQNAQLKVLAVMVGIALPSVEEIVVQVISGPYGVTEARYSIAELAHGYNAILATLRAINAEYAGFAPSSEACRYCPAINICEAVNKIAATQYTMLPDGKQAGAILDQCEVLERRIEAIREHYAERMSNDPTYQVPGFAMMPGPQRRTVEDWKRARARLDEFIDPAELEALANYSIPSVEKLVAKALKLKAKEASVKLAEILGDLLTVRQGNLCLKRVSGKPKLVSLELPTATEK
jgi:hypothetical protein